ncbi:MAG: hypothetical protein Q4C89_08330 [Deinococcus sp.]|uniref:hypothetical protein n=1 Tax=Deinococcus sp. TaxID=47478 RepID=UPI0026DB6C79|nr:hypothetical protein [Deinococcus sp.]MDO4246014.1 hypothetical protein [Deinococcus sp.]
MLQRLHQLPRHSRLAWLWPAFTLTAALALSLRFPEDRTLLSQLALFDVTVTTALIVLFSMPRSQRGFRPLLGVVLRGAALAALVFPEVRSVLKLEVLLVVLSAVFALRGLKRPLPEGFSELDDLERTYAFWLRLSRHPRLHRPLLWDLTLFKHLLMRPRLPAGQHFGTRHGASTGSTFTLLIFGSVVEGLLSHVLLERWQPLVAWVWTALNVLGLVWLLAYGRALSTRPVTLTHRRLYLRSGLHWTASTPRANVHQARPYSPELDQDALNIAIDVRPNVTLECIVPLRVLGMYWVERETAKVALHLDNPAAFMEALQGTDTRPLDRCR